MKAGCGGRAALGPSFEREPYPLQDHRGGHRYPLRGADRAACRRLRERQRQIEYTPAMTNQQLTCPRCGSTKHYVIRGRANVRCAQCKRDFSATSGTIWASPKMPEEKRAEILRLLTEENMSALAVSKKVGVQYKTVWSIWKKFLADWNEKHGQKVKPVRFRAGDMVTNVRLGSDFKTGIVTDPRPGSRWVSVQTVHDGKWRSWLKANLDNPDDQVRRAEGDDSDD